MPSGHRDFIFASKKTKALKLRYITRLFAKEMVNRNFPGLPREQLLERLIGLFEFFYSQAGIFDYSSHCVGVNRIISWNSDEMNSI